MRSLPVRGQPGGRGGQPANATPCGRRYAYVYDNPVNLTDSSGHFVDTLWDAVNLAVDLKQCFGETDSLSCYMLPVDALFLAVPLATGSGALKAAARAEKAGTARRTAYLLGGGQATREGADQIWELSLRYERVIVNDIDSEALGGVQDMLNATHKGENLKKVEYVLGPASNFGSLKNADIFVVAPNPGWLHPSYGGTLAGDLDILVGQGSRAYITTELISTSEFAKLLSRYEWSLPHPVEIGYKRGTRIARGVQINSVHFADAFRYNDPVNMMIVTR